jgi:hypothetical protein
MDGSGGDVGIDYSVGVGVGIVVGAGGVLSGVLSGPAGLGPAFDVHFLGEGTETGCSRSWGGCGTSTFNDEVIAVVDERVSSRHTGGGWWWWFGC